MGKRAEAVSVSRPLGPHQSLLLWLSPDLAGSPSQSSGELPLQLPRELADFPEISSEPLDQAQPHGSGVRAGKPGGEWGGGAVCIIFQQTMLPEVFQRS